MRIKKHWFYTELEISKEELQMMSHERPYNFIYEWLRRFFQ